MQPDLRSSWWSGRCLPTLWQQSQELQSTSFPGGRNLWFRASMWEQEWKLCELEARRKKKTFRTFRTHEMNLIFQSCSAHSPSSRVEQSGAVEAGPVPAFVFAWTSTPYLVEGLRLLRTTLSTSRVALMLRRCHRLNCFSAGSYSL